MKSKPPEELLCREGNMSAVLEFMSAFIYYVLGKKVCKFYLKKLHWLQIREVGKGEVLEVLEELHSL